MNNQQEQQFTADSIRTRIITLRNNSKDTQFNQYLTQLLNDLDTSRATPLQIANEVERVYKIYREKQDEADESKAGGTEYTIGATVIGVFGAIFLLVGFITFGINYLEGIWQAIFLYIISILIIIGSEFFVKRKLPKFAYVLTGLGVASLYASTIINYMYIKAIGSIVAAVVTLFIAAFSFLLSRKSDSVMMRMISFIGCYLSFLLVLRFQNQVEFLVAVGVLFLVNITSFYLPNQKHGEIINKVHMGLNTLFILIFSALAKNDDVMGIYIILGLILNIVLINIVCLNQKKDVLTTVLFGIEVGALSIMVLSILRELTHPPFPEQVIEQQIYYLVLVFVMILSVSAFFYIMNRDKIGRAYQYYFFVVFTMFLLIEPIDKEYIWGMLILFIVVKAFSHVKEYEGVNAIVTVSAFYAGLACINEWQTWLFVGLAILSIPLIKRWFLFYQYTISVYLLIFSGQMMRYLDRQQVFEKQILESFYIPVAASILFILVLIFNITRHFITKELKPIYPMVYNLSALSIIGLFSFSSIASNDIWTRSLTALIGAISIILFINPFFHINMKKKHLILSGYLVFMTIVVRFPNPMITSIVFMFIAVTCVIIGFWICDKAQRICGLVLALFVCAKIALYDFRGLESMQQAIVFMVVGAFALMISMIYIYLERRREEKNSVEKNPDEEYNQLNPVCDTVITSDEDE